MTTKLLWGLSRTITIFSLVVEQTQGYGISWQNQTNPILFCWYHDAEHQLSQALSTQALILRPWSVCTWKCDISSKKPIACLETCDSLQSQRDSIYPSAEDQDIEAHKIYKCIYTARKYLAVSVQVNFVKLVAQHYMYTET